MDTQGIDMKNCVNSVKEPIGEEAEELTDDIDGLDDLDALISEEEKKTEDDMEIVAGETHQNLPAIKEQKDLMESINAVNMFIVKETEVLSKTIDESFSVVIKSISDFSQSLLESGLLDANQSEKLAKGTKILENYAGLAKAGFVAYKHNKMLEELINKKMEIASTRHKAVKRILKTAKDNLESVSALLVQCADMEYQLDGLTAEHAILLCSNANKICEIFRNNQYSVLILNYLASEYDAWMKGKQRGAMEFPTYRNATIETINKLMRKKESASVVFKNLLAKSNSKTSVTGRDLIFVSNNALSAFLLSDMGGDNGKKIDVRNPRALNVEQLTVLNDSESRHPLIKSLVDKNDNFKIAEEYATKVSDADLDFISLLKPFLITGLITVGLYYLIVFLPIGGGWKFFLKLINFFSMFSIYKSLNLTERDKRGHKVFILRNKLRRHLLCASGFVYREEMDLEEKNVVKEMFIEMTK